MSENLDIANLIANSTQGGGMVLLVYLLFKKIEKLELALIKYAEVMGEYFEFVKGNAEYERGRRDGEKPRKKSPI